MSLWDWNHHVQKGPAAQIQAGVSIRGCSGWNRGAGHVKEREQSPGPGQGWGGATRKAASSLSTAQQGQGRETELRAAVLRIPMFQGEGISPSLPQLGEGGPQRPPLEDRWV